MNKQIKQITILVCPPKQLFVVINVTPKTNLGKREFILCYTFRLLFIIEGNQSGNTSSKKLKQKSWRNPAYWLNHGLTLCVLLYVSQNNLARDSCVHDELGPPSSINHQDNVPK